MKRITIALLLLASTLPANANANANANETVEGLLKGYSQQGAGPFSAERGAELWRQQVTVEGERRDCIRCHGSDLTQPGKQANTGKRIEPLAPSANPERLADEKKVEKWFKRNCKWSWGRSCTPQEKGDLLRYLATQ